jgi:UDP-glucuronate decarboxylase
MGTQSALVAGGSGFIGSHFCERLLGEGYHVICVDNFGSGRQTNVDHLVSRERFELLEGDIREREEYPEVDEIYHLASRASPKDFTEYPVQIALTNTKGTRHLLDHAVACDARMLFASTSEIYGNPDVHPQPETYNGNVNIRGPRGCYDEGKRFGETLTVAYHREYDLDVRTVRIFNTYGPRMRSDDGRVIPNFVSQAVGGENLTVYGDGSQTRSFCYVSDLVDGLRDLMTTPGLDGEVINLGSSDEISILSLAELILDISDADSDIVYEPLPEDDPERRQPDLTRAREHLNFECDVSLREGLQRTIADFESTGESAP